MNQTAQANKDSSLLVVVNHKGECSLVKKTNHWKPLFRIPGGTVEREDENILATALRETKEETGIEFDDPTKIHFLFSEWNDRREHFYHVFGVIIPNFSGLHGVPVLDGDDLLEVEVIDLSDAIKDGAMVPQHRNMLKKAVDKLSELC